MRACRGNGFVRLVKRVPKADPWAVYDSLPAPIRAALQEGPEQLCPLAIFRLLQRDLRRGYSKARAVEHALWAINFEHRRRIFSALPWQPQGHRRHRPLLSPHALANATMQTSGRQVP
jgi:hypothetical protein